MTTGKMLVTANSCVVLAFALSMLGCVPTDDDEHAGGDAGYQTDTGGPSTGEIEEVLARVSACVDSDSRYGIGLMYTMFDAYQRVAGVSQSTDLKITGLMFDCYIEATNCEEVRACGHATEAQGQVCSGTDDDPHCSGDVLVECSDDPEEPHEAYDCGAAGMVCGEGDSDADCGESRCTPGTDADYCQGDALWECDYGSDVYIVRDCRYSIGYHCSQEGEEWVCFQYAGGTCQEDPEYEGEFVCIGTGPECDSSTFQNYCEGTTLVSCRNDKEARYDCRNNGSHMTCGESDSGHMECVEAAGACSLRTPETCADGVITYCAAGRVEQLNCRTYGYSGCGTGVSITGIIGYCTP
ncbi:MAG: hypothetical protein JW797_19845 [Bradymonadales bacterium]|nr:hypothetical protein [Bradymonadales bacterium]